LGIVAACRRREAEGKLFGKPRRGGGSMKFISNTILCATTLACLAALAADVYPGVLNDLLFTAILLSFFVGPIVAIAVLVGLYFLARRGKLRRDEFSFYAVAAAVAILVTTLSLLVFDVPSRFAFAVSQASFEPLVENAPVSGHHGTPLNRRLGVYKVDEYAADPRGGVYFRVYTGFDGIGPDQMSYGFAHQPNAQGTPFGGARYEVYPLGRDWYWFSASDDWY
jgi:hypothetical protein